MLSVRYGRRCGLRELRIESGDMARELPNSISSPVGALYILDGVAEMLQTIQLNSEDDSARLTAICSEIIEMRNRQLKAADRAFNKELREGK